MKEIIMDRTGRIVIPKVFRNQIGLTEGTPIHFSCDPKQEILILQKSKRTCLKCHSENDLPEIKDGICLCSDCLRNLKSNL